MNRPRAFVEAPAGLASVSLRLHGGPHCRPPISRMGNKAGYAEVILAALGLRSGQGAGCYIWGEADPDVRGLLRAYPDAALLRRVAAIIRGWADEEPRALWERLRAERKARGPRVDEGGTAGWVVLGAWSFRGADPETGFNQSEAIGHPASHKYPRSCEIMGEACLTLAEYATIAAGNRLIHVADDGTGDLRNTGQGGTRFGGEFATPPADVAAAFERVAGEVAATAWTEQRTMIGGNFKPREVAGDNHTGGAFNYSPDAPAPAVESLASSRWPPVAVLPTIPTAAELAALLGTPGDLEGVVVMSDPPYQNTTGYAHDLPRAAVVDFVRGYRAMGARVVVCEQEPIPELMAEGWHATEITEGRKGQKRTFSAQKSEWLTLSHPPAHVVATQVSMFAGR